MELEDLYAKVNEELGLEDNSLAIILYGSRTRDDYKQSSDLDILVITKDNGPYFNRVGKVIDGIPIEIVYYSSHTLEKSIKNDYWQNSTYYESVLLTGEIVYDPESILAYFYALLVRLKNTPKIKEERFRFEWEEQIYFEMEMFKNFDGGRKKFHYYNLVEIMRIIYHKIHNYSVIYPFKVYNLYTDEEKAQSSYKLTLPPKEFRDTFIDAMEATDMARSLNQLLDYIGYTYKNLMVPVVQDYLVEPFNRHLVVDNMLHLSKSVSKIEELLISDSHDKDFAYFQLMTIFSKYVRMLDDSQREEFNNLFNIALETEDTDERIRIIEDMYSMFSRIYKFDPNNYSLLRYH